ncbi:MAG: tetratricopeptide repeat protein [Candidatus Zixiibacteriota bacterium]
MNQTAKTSGELLKAADALFQDRNYEEARPVYDKAYQKAREEFNRPVEVEALSQMARLNLISGNVETGQDFLEKARERVSESEPLGWSRFLGVEGRFEWKTGNLKTAQDTFEQMFGYCVEHSLWGRAVDAAHMVAIVGEKIEDQIKWTHKGIEMAEAHGALQWLGPLWNNLGGIYHDNKQFDSALGCYLKAREYHWQFSGESSKLFADYHIGMTYRLTGKIDEAAKWLRPVLAWAERLENHSAIGQACEDLGEIEIVRGNSKAGLELLKRAREEYKFENFEKTLPHVWENINRRIDQVGG